MTAAVKEPKERRQEKEILTPTQKKNLDETKHKYHRALEQLTGYNPVFSFNHASTDSRVCLYSATSSMNETTSSSVALIRYP